MFITMLAAALLGAQGRADVTPSTITGYTYEEGIGGSWINHSYYGAYSESGNVSGGGVQIKADPSGTDHIHHELIGGYAECGDAFSNAVTMNGGEVGALCGGGTGIVKYGTPYGGNSYSNSVTVNGGLIMETITGGNARENGNGSGGSANNNSVTLTNVQPSYNPYGVVPIEVFGGYGEYDAYSNSVTVTGSGDMRIWGGYAYDSDASGNTVSVTESQVTSVIGGKSTEGDASGNTVTIANSTVSEARLVDGIYGGYAEQGDANNNTVTVTGGQADTVEGGYGTNANGNTVTVSGVTIEYQVEGGRAFNDEGTANDNTVTMNGGRVGLIIAAIGDSTVGNTVVMNGGQTESICAGESYGGENSGNTVIVTEGELQYGISAGELFNGGELRNNRVYLVGKGATATIGGKQYTGGNAGIQAGGTIDAAYVFEDPEEGAPAFSASGNSIDVYGTGIKAGAVAYYGLTQALTFHLGDGLANAGEPMVTITSYGLNLTGVELGIRGDDVTDWSKFEGRSITLVQAAYNVTGVEAGTEVDIINEAGGTLATATLTLGSGNALVLTFSGELPGGQTSYTATPGSPQTSAPDTIYGAYAETGDVTGGSAAVFEVATGGYESLGNVYGGYAKSGNVSRCTATMDSGSAEFVYGGISAVSDYSESYDATDNTVTVNGGEVAWDVDGGNTLIGNATGNTVNMNGGMVVRNVEGGVSYVGNATGNTVNMSGGEVGNVFGGSTNDGDATGNTVSMTGGEVADTLYGGYTTLGNVTDNTVTLSDGDVGWYLYGGYVSEVSDDGNATGNTVIMNGGEVGVDVYGGVVEGSGDATGNMVILNNGDVNDDVCAGLTYKGEVSGNNVMMTGGSVSTGVYGAYSYEGNATGNTVLMAGGSAGYVYGGGAAGVYAATGNTVTMTGGEVAADVYGGFTESGEATGNTVRLVGKGASYTIGDTTYQGSEIAIQGSVYAGYAEEGGISENNTVHIHGTGIGIGGTIDDSQQLTFHLVQGQAGAPATPMVALGGALDLEGVELGFYGDAVTNWAAFKGKSITLVQAAYNVTGVAAGTEVDITDEVGETLATATLTLKNGKALVLTFPGDGPVPPPVPGEGPDALDVALVNSLWASSAYVREFVRLSEAQGYALKDGDTAVWGGGFGTFMHTTGNKGFKSDGGGYGIGVNHAFSANTQAGISFGQGFGSYHNSGADGATVHQRAILVAATLSNRVTKEFSLGAHVAFGSVRNRADCRLDGASERARWNDTVFNLGARAAYDFHVTEATAITPFLGMDWMNGAQDTIGGVYGRHYAHGRLNELRMPVGVTVSTSVEAGSAKLLPQLSVAYVPSLAQHLPHADVTGNGQGYRVKGYAPGRNAFMLNAGMNVLFTDSWSAGAFYTLETRRHSVNQSVNASVRYTF